MFLHLHDRRVVYREIEQRLPRSDEGTTLKEVRDCILSYGLDAAIVRGTPRSLGQGSLPQIVHWEEEAGVSGHYVVLIGVGDDHVQYIDGTTAIIHTMATPVFLKRWTGYMVVHAPRHFASILFVSLIVVGLLLMGYAYWASKQLIAQTKTNYDM